MKLKDFRVWEYRKGFRRDNKIVYGLTAMFFYTLGFIKYHMK